MIEIRRMETDDLFQFHRMHTIVYNMRGNFSKKEDYHHDPLGHPADWAIGAFDGGKLLAGTYEIDYLMRFDGHSVKMSGIGGVGTLPEARRGGHIRHIFEKILPESFEKGFIFSNLSPFSHDFYRKFGYELCCTRNNIEIPTGDFDIKQTGSFTPVLPGDDTGELAKVHSAYIADINHGIHRDYWPDNRAWKQFTREDPCSSGTFIFLWKDENGVPRSYIKYKDEFDDGDHKMAVSELAFIDKKGLYGILGIISGLTAQYRAFKWQMPAFIDPFDFIGDAWEVETCIKPREMTRVINVKKALELMRRPNFSGEYVIEVEDENIAANSGRYLVEFAPEGTKVTKTSKESDISCGILVLSQLITGYRTLENALYSRQDDLEVTGNLDTLLRVFTQRPQHVTEYF